MRFIKCFTIFSHDIHVVYEFLLMVEHNNKLTYGMTQALANIGMFFDVEELVTPCVIFIKLLTEVATELPDVNVSSQGC